MAMWHYSCTMVTRLLICVAKSGGQGLDSDRTLLFLTNLPTILMLAPTWELSAPWSHDSHVFCIRRAFWTWEQWEQCKLLWSYVNYVKLKSFLKSFVFFRAFLQGWNPAKGLPGGGILECAFCGPLGTLKRNHHSIALVALSNLFTSHILNVTLPWTICIDCIDISETSELLEPGSMVAVCSRCFGWEASEKKMPSNDNVRISEMLS